MTFDVQNRLVFLPIGTPTPDFYGGDQKLPACNSVQWSTALVANMAFVAKYNL